MKSGKEIKRGLEERREEKTSWGKVAPWYDNLVENDDSYQKNLILPNLIRLLNIKKGEHVLDLACGQGFFSRKIVKLGAEVIGIDISTELIKIAKEKSKDEDGLKDKDVSTEIKYFVSSAQDFSFIKDRSIDKILLVLAIQNIEDAGAVSKESFRVLKENGELHLVFNHPAFRIPKQSSWVFDNETKRQYRRIDSYLTESKNEIDMNPGKGEKSDKKKFTYSFHRPLQWYFKTITNVGFLISRMEEWVPNKKSEPGPRADEENRIRKEIPLFMYLKAIKK